MIRLSRRAFALAALLAPFAAHAQAPQVQQPWARASAGNAPNGAAYMTITTPAEDRLLSATSPAARVVELHTHLMDNGVMRMRQVPGIDLKPQEATVLRPGGLHVMLIGLQQPLRENSTFPLTLRFERGGEVTVEVRVLGVAATNAQGARGHSH